MYHVCVHKVTFRYTRILKKFHNSAVYTVKPLYSEQSLDQKNVHYTGVFTQEGWDMFMHTRAWNIIYTY